MVKSLPHETGQNASMQIPLEGQKIPGCNLLYSCQKAMTQI